MTTDLVKAKSQDELPLRRMSDSYREAIIPLGSDPKFTEKYINFYKGIRFGRILEDLDTFAGNHTVQLVSLILKTCAYRNGPKFSDRYAWANSADPDQTAPRGAV